MLVRRCRLEKCGHKKGLHVRSTGTNSQVITCHCLGARFTGGGGGVSMQIDFKGANRGAAAAGELTTSMRDDGKSRTQVITGNRCRGSTLGLVLTARRPEQGASTRLRTS